MTTDLNSIESKIKEPKKSKTGKILIILGVIFSLIMITYFYVAKGTVQSDKIGLLVTKRGAELEMKLMNGTIYAAPISELILFPLSVQTTKQSKLDGNQISFRSKDGILLKVETYCELSITPYLIFDFYRKYHSSFETVINNNFSHNIRDEFIFKASKMTADSILNHQEFFISEVEKKSKKIALENKFIMNKLGYLSPIEIPKELEKIVADIIFSKELKEKAKADKNRVVYELEMSEALNKKVLDSVVTSNLVRMHTQMTNNEMRINQFRTDSNVYAVKYNKEILEAMRIENYTKAIEKWNGALPNSQTQSLLFPFDNSLDKIKKETEKFNMNKKEN